jgi:hypothetical protein
MLLNTRNFLLYALSVGFLVIAITVTVLQDRASESRTATLPTVFSAQAAAVFTATTIDHESTLDRKGKIASLRQKIAEQGLTTSPKSDEDAVVEEAVVAAVIDLPEEPTTLACSDPIVTKPAWPVRGVKFEVVEGARIVYHDVLPPPVELSASGTATIASSTKAVLLQLPLHSVPLASKSCVPYDVIGVALDGSLIRNNEQAVYAIFGSESLIGYALDGFPLYGKNDEADLDFCGGLSVAGQYAYYLNSERSTMLDCFSGKPVNL